MSVKPEEPKPPKGDARGMTKADLRRLRSTTHYRLRTVGKDLARRAGYDLHEWGSTGRSAALVLDMIKASGWEPASVIDIGVAYGTHDLYSAFPHARYLLVEPVNEWLPEMQRATRELEATIVEAAATDFDGEVEINIYNDPAATSVLNDRARRGEPAEKRVVRAAKLDSLVMDWIPVVPLLVKIDVQGFEGRVLAGAAGVLSIADLLLIETSLRPNYTGGTDMYTLVKVLGELGFRPFDLFDGCVKDGALLQVDLAFVRKTSDLWHRLGLAEGGN